MPKLLELGSRNPLQSIAPLMKSKWKIILKLQHWFKSYHNMNFGADIVVDFLWGGMSTGRSVTNVASPSSLTMLSKVTFCKYSFN